MDSPRNADARDSPRTQRTASMTFDLPQPLGPTTPTRSPGRGISVGSTKDLKPASLMWERRNLWFATSYNCAARINGLEEPSDGPLWRTCPGKIILTDLTEIRECPAALQKTWKSSVTRRQRGIIKFTWKFPS